MKVPKWRRILLRIAWLVAIGSLALPAFPGPVPLLPLPYMPVLLLALAIPLLLNGSASGGGFFLFIPAELCFILTPLLLHYIPVWGWARVIRWVVIFGLLSIWSAPLLIIATGDRGGALAYGFYIFAGAHTLAFIACAHGWKGGPSGSSKVGFPVLPPGSESTPPALMTSI
jgi:hypothetical protein